MYMKDSSAVLAAALAVFLVGVWKPVTARSDAIQGGCNFEIHSMGKGTWTCAAPERSGLCFWNIERLSANPNEKTYTEEQVGSRVIRINYNVPLLGIGPGRPGSWLGIKVNYWYAPSGESCEHAPDWSGRPGVLQGPGSRPRVEWQPGDAGSQPATGTGNGTVTGPFRSFYATGRFLCYSNKDQSAAGDCTITATASTCEAARQAVDRNTVGRDVCRECPSGAGIDNTKHWNGMRMWIHDGACR